MEPTETQSQTMPSSDHRPFGLQALTEIDNGKIKTAFNSLVRGAIADVTDRPGETKARKVTLEVSITPCVDKETGALSDIDYKINLKTSIPNKSTATYKMKPVTNDEAIVSITSPHQPAQMHMNSIVGQ